MTPTRTGVVLLILYVAAVWVRTHDTDPARYPYYNGASATHFRVAAAVAENGKVSALDQRVSWPNGYEPARSAPVGVEYVTGQLFRVVGKFSDVPARRFAELFTAFFYSLSILAFFLLARSLWSCPAAGLLAAFMAAFFLPLINVSDGREFLHAPFAATIVAFIAAVLAAWFARPRTALVWTMSLLIVALLAMWEHAGMAAAVIAVIVLVAAREERGTRALLVGTALAVVAGGLLFPHLRAERFLAKWPALLTIVAAAYAFVGQRLPRKIPAIAWVAGLTVVATAMARPIVAGGVAIPSLDAYWLARVRFLFGKPEDPSLLSETVRTMWQHRTSNPGVHGLVNFTLPLLLLVPTTVMGLRAYRRDGGRNATAALVLAGLGIVVFLIDRSAIFLAGLTVIPLAACSLYGFRRQWLIRIPFIVVAAGLTFAAAIAPFNQMNPTTRLATALGSSQEIDEGFLWVSIGNADQDLVRHLVKRSLVKDLFLAPPRIAPLLVQFAGRKLVAVPGIGTTEGAARMTEYMSLYYGDEARLYERCRSLGVTYVVYSIDVLLDLSRHSPRYTAGLGYLPSECVARDMHFKPERLKHFTLVYENDNHRVFRVSQDTEPFFLTDHPPVYRESIVRRTGETLDKFYDRIVDVLLVYGTARAAQDRQNDPMALRRFRYCVEQVPEFTRAWIGVGDSMLRQDQLEAARAAYTRALQLAPDNAHALYFGAVVLARLGHGDQAQGMLEVLLNSTDDRYLLDQGRELKRFLEGGGSLEDGPSES